MMRPVRIGSTLAYLALLTIGTGSALAADGSGTEIDGKASLKKNCGRCHSIEATGESPLKEAPPLRELYLRYPIEQLEYGLAEGMGSRHPEMPQIQFSTEEISAILNYLGNIAGIAPSKRAPAAIPGETEPP
jgi:mono/diheme cytochrome c family protein